MVLQCLLQLVLREELWITTLIDITEEEEVVEVMEGGSNGARLHWLTSTLGEVRVCLNTAACLCPFSSCIPLHCCCGEEKGGRQLSAHQLIINGL